MNLILADAIHIMNQNLELLGVIYALLGACFVALEAILSKQAMESGGSPLFISITVTTVTGIIFWSFLGMSGRLAYVSYPSVFS